MLNSNMWVCLGQLAGQNAQRPSARSLPDLMTMRRRWWRAGVESVKKVAPETHLRGVTRPSSMKWGWDEATRPSPNARKGSCLASGPPTKHGGSSRAADAASLPHLIHGCGSPTSTQRDHCLERAERIEPAVARIDVFLDRWDQIRITRHLPLSSHYLPL